MKKKRVKFQRFAYAKYLAFAVLSLFILTGAAAGASASVGDLSRVLDGGRLPRYVDDAGILTEEQASELTAKLDEISLRSQFDIVIAVVTRLDHREARMYAADFFEQNGYGFGDELDGVILLLAMDDREYGYAAIGFGNTAFSEAGLDYMEEQYMPPLREGRYYDAFSVFAEMADDMVASAKAGKPYDEGYLPLAATMRSRYRTIAVIISLAVALVAAFATTTIWMFQLKSVRRQNLANEYIGAGGVNITGRKDIFLYRRVSKERKPESGGANSGGRIGGGGGGSSFRTSSGRSATGRSGKF